MNELPPELSSLIASARVGHDPTPADQERVHAALLAKLGVAAVVTTGAVTTGASTTKAAFGVGGAHAAVKALCVAALIATGTGIFYAVAPSPRASVSQPPVQPIQPIQPSRAQPLPAPAPATPKAEPALRSAQPSVEPERKRSSAPRKPVRAPSAATRVAADSGGQQTALQLAPVGTTPEPVAVNEPAVTAAVSGKPAPGGELVAIRAALTALRDQQPGAALTALEEHARRFPHGALMRERAGLRVVALCQLGRQDEGRREQAAYLAHDDSSALARRVSAACGKPAP